MSNETQTPADSKQWIRVRFISTEGDSRPVKWPPPGPFWCTGYFGDEAVIVAYIKQKSQLNEYWPDAIDPAFSEEEISFSSRFPCPDWWDKNKQELWPI